jgi:hypothetical protein
VLYIIAFSVWLFLRNVLLVRERGPIWKDAGVEGLADFSFIRKDLFLESEGACLPLL